MDYRLGLSFALRERRTSTARAPGERMNAARTAVVVLGGVALLAIG
jgi:hypothetical protein